MRPEQRRCGERIRLFGQRAGDGKAGIAQAGGVSRVQAQPVEHDLGGQQVILPVGAGQPGIRGGGDGGADQWPRGIDGLELDQGALAGGGDKQGTQFDDLRQAGAAADEPGA